MTYFTSFTIREAGSCVTARTLRRFETGRRGMGKIGGDPEIIAPGSRAAPFWSSPYADWGPAVAAIRAAVESVFLGKMLHNANIADSAANQLLVRCNSGGVVVRRRFA